MNNFLLFCFCLLPFLFQDFISAYTLTPSESIKDGQKLLSKSGTFELGFFSPSASKTRFLGIWYKSIPVQKVVWVANRDSPLHDTSGVLTISSTTGNLVILNRTNHLVWSTNTSKIAGNPIVEFLESGNIVLRDGNSDEYVWQSFDYPTDTLLPGMKLGWELKSGLDRYIRSWKNDNDPSSGDYTYGIELTGYSVPVVPIVAVLRNGSNKYYRTGQWNGITYSGSPELKPNSIFKYDIVHNEDEAYYIFQLVNESVPSILVMKQSDDGGQMQRLTWIHQSQSWVLYAAVPRDRCDNYALCGVGTTCDITDSPVCRCLKGFKPRSPQDWNNMEWSRGCERVKPLCDKGDGFIKSTGLKLPDTTHSWMNLSMNLEECRAKCLHNCSCMAYTNPNIRGGGSGCLMWFGDLIDIRLMNGAGQDLYIRMADSELEKSESASRKQKGKILTIIMVLIGGMLVFGCCGGFYISNKEKICLFFKSIKSKGESGKDDLELPLFDLDTISTATNNFSEKNKLGEGGFGPVYKGKFPEGQEIAVKRLSEKSTQGLDEFKNELILISKIQHKNLVKLLGYCIQGEEIMLVYEYMPNGSLDHYIFDKTRSKFLDWQKRFDIILGVARGLLYLHHDSRLTIIHRDLKGSNILLDGDMHPKISDFGIARICVGDQTEAKTKRIVGTHGYMSPEYAVDGHFSFKSDVFSFGVVVLEILSGKRNRGFYHPDHSLNLLGHAWGLWNEHKAMDLVDETMGNSLVEQEVLRCIHIGLLCVQQCKHQRPTMSTVILMLSSDSIVLSQPQPPGFYIERTIVNPSSNFTEKETCVSSDVSITLLEGR